jgi:hypothetical protein
MQKDLFGNTWSGQPTALKDARPMPEGENNNTCGGCKHLYRHEYNKEFKYCRLFKQIGTAYGNLKIKSRMAACIKFEQNEND